MTCFMLSHLEQLLAWLPSHAEPQQLPSLRPPSSSSLPWPDAPHTADSSTETTLNNCHRDNGQAEPKLVVCVHLCVLGSVGLCLGSVGLCWALLSSVCYNNAD